MKHFLFILTLLSLAAFHHSAHANAVLAEPMKPISISRMVSSSNLVTASTQFAGRTAANQSVYARAAVNISKASIANAYRARAFSPWGFALVAALTTAGYVLQDDEYVTTTEPSPPTSEDIVICTDSLSICVSQFNNIPLGSTAYFYNSPNYYHVSVGHFTSACSTPVLYQTDYTYSNNLTSRKNDRCNGLYPAITAKRYELLEDLPLKPSIQRPLNDDELFDVFNDLPSSQKFDVLNNPNTGTPDTSNIPEFDQKAQEISNNWDSNYDDDPVTLPNPDTGEVTSDDPLPEDESDIDICKYDPDILACQDLGDTPDETPIDTQEINFDYSPVPFSSSAVCPAPKQLPGGFTYDYQPACDFASGVRPAVVVMALLAGVYLLVGFKR